MRSHYASETAPLTAGIATRIAPSSSGALRHKYSLSTRATRYAKYALAFATLLVVGNLMVFRNVDSSSMRATADADTDRDLLLVAEGLTVSAAVNKASFPGAEDEIVDSIAKPKAYTSRLFSGYLPLANGGEAFYFLAESQSETSESDPVLLWLNGGPGASSLAGCFTENGPLFVNDDGRSVRVNEQAWNQNAHLLCIESPVGVGFSYNASGVYVADDVSQADDLYDALQQFFVKFPQLRANEFIISGESYGGIYVPTTARAIVEGNLKLQDSNSDKKINLTKFVVGNGVNEFSGLSIMLYAYYHGIMSTEEYQEVRTNCPNLKEYEPSTALFDLDLDSQCGQTMMRVVTKLFMSQINMYNIYGTCAGTPEEGMKALVQALMTPQNGHPHPIGNPMTMCLNSTQLDVYFNLEDVRDAFHTKPEIDRWYGDALTTTSTKIYSGLAGLDPAKLEHAHLLDYTGTLKQRVTPIWKELLAHGVKGVIYHGDVDMVCDFIGGLWAVESLKLQRLGKRKTWSVELDGTQQTGGFVEEFKGLTYVTVKGAGHLVPMWKPVEAKRMLDLFVLEREG
ncbi:Serine protease family s10, partial [Globisporangium splendens]